MSNTDNKKPLHTGHRGRMKDKLFTYGPKMFATYELLEMLLYYVIPYKDTKPVAKRLLMQFGSIDGVFNAKKEDLEAVDGVGESCAEFILAVAQAKSLMEHNTDTKALPIFLDYNKTGEYIVSFFKRNEQSNVLLLLLDAGMQLIREEKVSVSSFGSAEVRPELFVRPALKAGAEVAIIAYTHPYGPLFPTEADRETGKLIFDELSAVGIPLVEQYIVCSDSFVGIGTGLSLKFSSNPLLKNFLDSKERGSGTRVE